MHFYQVQMDQKRIINNGYTNDANYVCSLTMKASIVLAILQSMKDPRKREVIDCSRADISQLTIRLEECIKNRSYFKKLIRHYKLHLSLEDFDKGLVELLAVCHFLLEESFQKTDKIWFIQTTLLEWEVV